MVNASPIRLDPHDLTTAWAYPEIVTSPFTGTPEQRLSQALLVLQAASREVDRIAADLPRSLREHAGVLARDVGVAVTTYGRSVLGLT